MALKTNGRILFADLADVVAALAQGNYCVLQRETGSLLVRESISALTEKLRPYGFVQIHRSVLVNSPSLKRFEGVQWTNTAFA